jgi:molecular chaperone DnaK
MSGVTVGIDLGTTFSAIAWVNEHGVPEIIPNAEGDRITPSVILFDKDDVIVGTYAKQAATVYPDQVVEFIKRHMGDDDYRFRYGERACSPEELSHFILSKLKHDAEVRLGQPITAAVITVPAYFNDKQRRATLRAGRMAGLDELTLLNEPTAAAFAYGLKNMGGGARVLVFDLGGGTFDVTLVDLVDREIRVVATSGDDHLGGKEWDEALIDHVADQFVERHGLDPRADLASLHDLRAKCVSAKISLSRKPKVNIFHDFGGKVVRATVTKESFEALTRPLLERCEALTRQVLTDAGTDAGGVDTVLLAGGSTRMPMVRDLLQRMFGRAPATDMNPDEAVALGAALTAALEGAKRTGGPAPVDLRTHDVTSHTLGLAVVRDGGLAAAKIIPKNTRIPAERTRTDITTTYDGQTAVDLWLVQGESPDPLACAILGHFEFYGVPPRPAGASRISVTYRYSVSAIVEVEAMDLATGQVLPFRMAGQNVTLADIAAGRIPHQLIIVVDASGSMYGSRFTEARACVERLVHHTLGQPNRRVALVASPGGVRQLPTRDAGRLTGALDALIPIGASPMGAVLDRADEAIPPEPGVGRNVIVITDGRVDDPDALVATSRRLQDTGARVVTIAISGPGATADADLALLQRVASAPEDCVGPDDTIELRGGFANLATWAQDGRAAGGVG